MTFDNQKPFSNDPSQNYGVDWPTFEDSLPSNDRRGFVYILTNPSQKYIKIGRTVNLERRIKELSAVTGVAMPFCFYHYEYFEDCVHAEYLTHNYFSKFRVSNSREFFDVDPAEVKNFLTKQKELPIKKEVPKKLDWSAKGILLLAWQSIWFWRAIAATLLYLYLKLMILSWFGAPIQPVERKAEEAASRKAIEDSVNIDTQGLSGAVPTNSMDNMGAVAKESPLSSAPPTFAPTGSQSKQMEKKTVDEKLGNGVTSQVEQAKSVQTPLKPESPQPIELEPEKPVLSLAELRLLFKSRGEANRKYKSLMIQFKAPATEIPIKGKWPGVECETVKQPEGIVSTSEVLVSGTVKGKGFFNRTIKFSECLIEKMTP